MPQRACFTGHREIAPHELGAVKRALARTIDTLVDRGITTFIAGGAMGFDTLAANAVLDARERHPDVHLILALPCEDQTHGWRADAVAEYTRIRERADHVKVLSPTYHRGCMHVRNRYMVDRSDVCICYLRTASGGTAYTVTYAESKGLEIIRL